MKLCGYLSLIAIAIASCGSTEVADPPGSIDVGVETAQRLLSSATPPLVLDVRRSEEYEAGHLVGARNIDVERATFADQLGELDVSQPYLVHCAAGVPGGRSRRAVETMQDMGFRNIYHLEGGYNAWASAGNRTE